MIDELAKQFMKEFDDIIERDALTDIIAYYPGHSRNYYNTILSHCRVYARKRNWALDYTVRSLEFWSWLEGIIKL